MTQRELLEHALLDALSLLDDDEREAFDRAFAAAPPHVQAQVRREQTRLVRMESLLPDVAPPASLRARVIEAVRAAMAGQHHPAEEQDGSLALYEPDTIARLPAVAHRKKVAAVWRAAALACAAAAIVLGVTTLRLQGVMADLNAHQDQLLEKVKEAFGPDYIIDALVDGSTQRITLASHESQQEEPAQAAIWFNPDWRTAKLFGINLPATKDNRYKLVVVNEAGETVDTVAEFTFRGGLLNEEVPVTVGLASDRLAILGGDEVGQEQMLLGVPQLLQSY